MRTAPDRRRDPGEATRGWSAERIALEDARFREANERISDSATDLGFSSEEIPFVCECADPGCQEVILMSLADYEEVRDDSTHFLNVPGHAAAAQQFGRVVEEHLRYVVVEKTGRAGEVAVLTDHRDDEVT